MESPNIFHLGVDWAKQAHDADLTRADGTRLAHGRFPHRGEGMAQLQDWLQEHTGGGEIAAVIEVPHGAVVEALQAMGVAVYAVNPKPLFHDRESSAMSGAKDDRRDARRLSSIPRIAPEILRPAAIASAPLRALRRATQLRAQWVADRTALTTRLQDIQREYFPELANLAGDAHAESFLDLCAAVPSPAVAAERDVATWNARLPQRRGRRRATAQQLAQLQARPLAVSPEIVAELQEDMLSMVRLLRQLHAEIEAVEQRIAERLDVIEQSAPAAAAVGTDADGDDADGDDAVSVTEHGAPAGPRAGDMARLRSVPGIGHAVLPVLIAHAGDGIGRRDDWAMRRLTGVAPVTHPSGRMRGGRMRRAASTPLRNAVHDMAQTATRVDPASKQYDRYLRDRGHTHGRALRAVGDRLLRIIFAMLRDGTDFDIHRPSRWTLPSVTRNATHEEARANAL